MITFELFKTIDIEVENAVTSAFETIKNINSDNYVLLLANAEYLPSWEGARFNPHVIDYKLDFTIDHNRLDFILKFMRAYYSFAGQKDKTEDSDELLHLELMMYSHIWESKPFLKKLKRMSLLVDIHNYSYPWKTNIPDMGKHELIRNEIRKSFKSQNLNIATIIKKGYHSSLRNAFAHSEYYFNSHINTIILGNYKGGKWELKNILFDEWTIRFVNSFLLNYYVLKNIEDRRKSLKVDLGSESFKIILPINDKSSKVTTIYYDPKKDYFNFRS